MFIYPIQRERLYSEFKDGKPTGGGYIRTVRMFFAIGMAILLIACINFMNMNTARSQKRALEVGVRKTFGAKYRRLIGQFMGESALVTFISLIVAVALVLIALPAFNQLISLHLAVDITNPYHSIGLLAVGLLCTLLSGAYPAFYMSSFSPIQTLKKLKTNLAGSAGMVRKGLVVFQFAVSFVLISSTAIIYLQIRHVQNRPLGLELKQLVLFQAPDEMKRNFSAVQEALINTGVVAHSGLSSQQLISLGNNGGGYNWQGKAPDIDPLVSLVSVSPGLIDAAGIRFWEGGDFSWQLFGEKQEVIINRSFADMMGEEGRVGGIIEREYPFQIVGIVEDFVFNDYTRGKAEPVLFRAHLGSAGNLFVRLKEGVRESEAIGIVQKTLQQYAQASVSFEPSWLEETFNRGFNGQQFTGKLAALFAALAVFLSCMGLFGLSAFAAEQRTKEIGVRKVLGASVWDIVYLLGRSFLQLLLISFVIAIPAAWYAGRMYLQNYDYRISIGRYIFAGAALLVFIIAMLTVSMQSLKAATADPVRAIKTE
jgi:ABC-type antimicrobial peptide transport system permease subunit